MGRRKPREDRARTQTAAALILRRYSPLLTSLIVIGLIFGATGAQASGVQWSGLGDPTLVEGDLTLEVAPATSLPLFSVSPNGYDFGDEGVGVTSGSKDFSVGNNTDNGSTLDISSVSIAGPNAPEFSLASDDCTGASLPYSDYNNENCDVYVKFSPTSPGAQSAELVFTDNASDSPESIPLTGVGSLPLFSVSSTSYDFGNDGVDTSSGNEDFKVSDSANNSSTLDIASVGLDGPGASEFSIVANDCMGVTLPYSDNNDENCDVYVKFSPTSPGAQSATLVFTDNASDSPESIPLTGVGSLPLFAVSPTNHSFGDQSVDSSSGSQDFNVEDSVENSSLLEVSSVMVLGPGASEFNVSSDDCVGALLANVYRPKSCDVNVKFSPTSAGEQSAYLSFTDNALDSPETVALTGMGTACASGCALPPPAPPKLSGLVLSPRSFMAKAGSSISPEVGEGTAVSYQDSQQGRTIFSVLQSRQGFKSGKGVCSKPPKRRKKGKGCKYNVVLGNFVHSDSAGSNEFRFTGSVKGRALAAGEYQLQAVATVGKLSSVPVTESFQVKR